MSHAMDALFKPQSGRIFKCFPGAEERPGQRHMAELVFDAVRAGADRHEVWRNGDADLDDKPDAFIQAIEAGTGTGKSLGYLLPSLKGGRHPVIVATRTKQLQRQLMDEDLPRARGILDVPVKAVLAKGRSNYLCRAMWVSASRTPPAELLKSDFALWQSLPKWVKETQTGDREELGRNGEGESELWERLNARSERCVGKKCPFYESCFLSTLRAELQEADLIIVNHALLLADRVVRESEFGQILPDAPVLILDEAHEIEEQLTESCSEIWTSRAMAMLFRDLLAESLRDNGAAMVDALSLDWQAAWDNFVALVPHEHSVLELDDPRLPLPAIVDALGLWIDSGRKVAQEIRRLAAREKEGQADDLLWGKLLDRVETAFARMEQIFAQPTGWVSTLSRENYTTVNFKSSPVDVKPFFHKHIRRGFETVILTSATLRDGKGFNGLKLRLGLTQEETDRGANVESPFDFQNQGLLFVPPGMPERRAAKDGVGEPAWVEASLEAMERLLKASRGRGLLLFTSRKMLAAFRPRLEAALPGLTFFVQGEGLTRQAMVERFRRTPDAVILGLASFWQGVDLPGDVLSLVVVTALPFAPPDDPVLRARIREADAIKQGLGFVGIQVPQMTLKLKQGIGRLIRTRSDRGVVCILDPRLMLPGEDVYGKRYAAQIRASLPPFPITRDWREAESFLRKL